MQLDSLNLETFSPLEGTRFGLQSEDHGPVNLVLESAAALSVGGQSPRAPFSLLFRGPSGIELHQRIYRLSHETLGDVELFLVPMQPDDQGSLFEAVFT